MNISELLPLQVVLIGSHESPCHSISQLLQRYGFQQVQSLSGMSEFENSGKGASADLVVINLDDYPSGEKEVLIRLRQCLPSFTEVPILLLTSRGEDAVRRAMSGGVFLADVLIKPILDAESVMRVCNLLRLRWQHLKLRSGAFPSEESEQERRHVDDLHVATARLTALLENLQAGILVEDESHNVVMVNTEFCRLLALPVAPASLLGSDYGEILEETREFFAEPESYAARVREILDGQVLVTAEEIRLADGRTYERDYVPIFRGYRYLGNLWSYRDVTLRKRSEEQLRANVRRKAALMQSALDCVISIDHMGCIIEWNNAAERTFGYRQSEVLRRSLADLIVPHEFREAHTMGLLRQIQDGESRLLNKRIEVPALHADGHQFPVEISIARVEAPEGVQFTAFLRDISERKRFEYELAQARDEALASSRLKAEFLANMSHEIRTPINGVLGMLDLLADTPMSNDQSSLLRTAQTSAEALLTIINDILDLSKIEAGKLTIEDGVYSPRNVVEECLLIVAGNAYEKNLDLVPYIEREVPRRVRGDGHRVRQILTNFLSNAVKFTQEGEIVARVTFEPPLQLRFSVTDTGVGFGPETAAKLFMPFTQADGSTTRKFGGTGLGLAISKQLVELMDGKIGLESTPGQGATFWFTLPLRRVLDSEVPTTDENEAEEKKRASGKDNLQIFEPCSGGKRIEGSFRCARILVVEDNATQRFLLLKHLEAWGMAGGSAADSTSALQQLYSSARQGQPYEVVLLDAQLPDLDIEQFARTIKSDPLLQKVRLLRMSAFKSATDGDEIFLRTLSKPVRPSRLFDALIEIFESDHDPRHQRPDSSNALIIAPELASVEPEVGETPLSLGEGQCKILVADDNNINREVVTRWLTKWGCEIQPVTNGFEAVEAVKASVAEDAPFDLVLMDCQMPEMDGYEATQCIRQLYGRASEVPIIALTAHALEGDKEKCLNAGMDDYLPKPVRPPLLAEKVGLWRGGQHLTSASPERALATNDNTPTVDAAVLEQLSLILGNDVTSALIEEFVARAESYEHPLQEAIQTINYPQIKQGAARLRIVALQLGAFELAARCEQLEREAQSNSYENSQVALEAVLKAQGKACVTLSRLANGEKVA